MKSLIKIVIGLISFFTLTTTQANAENLIPNNLNIYNENTITNPKEQIINSNGENIFLYESLPNEFIVKNKEKSTSGYEKWTKIGDDKYKPNFYMGLHPDWKGSAKEKKASAYWFSTSRSKSFGFSFSGRVVGASISIESSRGNGFEVQADPTIWTRVGISGDIKSTYYKKDVYNGAGKLVRTYYEWADMVTRSTPISVGKW